MAQAQILQDESRLIAILPHSEKPYKMILSANHLVLVSDEHGTINLGLTQAIENIKIEAANWVSK